MASHEAAPVVPVAVPTSEEIVSKLATIGADRAEEILPKLCTALLCNSTMLSTAHCALLQEVTSTLQDIFPTVNVEDIISNVASAQIEPQTSCDTLAPEDKLMHSSVETAKNCTDDVLNGVISKGSEPESADQDDLMHTHNGPAQIVCVTETAEDCSQQMGISRPYCKVVDPCQWEIPTEISMSQGFTPSCVATGSSVIDKDIITPDKVSGCKHQQNGTYAADEDGIQQCRLRPLVTSTPKIPDPVGESEGFPVSSFLAQEQTPNGLSESNMQLSDTTTSGQLATPGDAAILENLQSGSISEQDDEDPMPGTMSSSEEEISAYQILRSIDNTNGREDPLRPVAEDETSSDTTTEDETESCNSSQVSDVSHIAETPEHLPQNGKAEESLTRSERKMTMKASLFDTSEDFEPETVTNHEASGGETGRPTNKRTLRNTSQDHEENGPLKKHCWTLVTVISPVVKLTRLPHRLTSSISGLEIQDIQPNMYKSATAQDTTAVGIEYKNSVGFEQSCEEQMQCLSNYSNIGSVEDRDSGDAPKSVDQNANPICESEPTDAEDDSVMLISNIRGEQEHHSEGTEICEQDERDVSLEASDRDSTTTVSMKDLEGTFSDQESVGSNGKQNEVSQHDKCNDVTENMGQGVSPTILLTRKDETGDASVIILSDETVVSDTPEEETERRSKKKNTKPTRETSRKGGKVLECACDRAEVQHQNGSKVVKMTGRRRRKPVPFSSLEEEAIFYGVSKYAKDNMIWKKIHMEGGFVGRTTSDLRDKYRNLESNRLAYDYVKWRVSEKREQKISPLKELRKYNKRKTLCTRERNTQVSYVPLISRRPENGASLSGTNSGKSDGSGTSKECVHESEEQKRRVSPRRAKAPNSGKSSEGQMTLQNRRYSKRILAAKEPREIAAECSPVLTTNESTSATSGRASVTQADVDEGNRNSPTQDSFMEDSAPSVVQGTSVAARSRQKRKFFCDAEVEALVYGVLKYGKGRWALIKRLGGFHNRSSIDLSDKYRNLEHSAERLSGLKEKVREKEGKGKNPLERWKSRSAQR